MAGSPAQARPPCRGHGELHVVPVAQVQQPFLVGQNNHIGDRRGG